MEGLSKDDTFSNILHLKKCIIKKWALADSSIFRELFADEAQEIPQGYSNIDNVNDRTADKDK